jgi:hypothetical protein
VDFKPTDMKMCVLRIEGRFQNYSFICVHAPRKKKIKRNRMRFMSNQREHNIHCPTNDINIADFSAKVRKESCAETVVGGTSLQDENNGNGVKIINFAGRQQMKTGGTFLHHKHIHEGTWRSPDGGTAN